MPDPTEIDALAARDLVGDDIVHLLKRILNASIDKGNGTASVPIGHITEAADLLVRWNEHNRAFEAAIRKRQP